MVEMGQRSVDVIGQERAGRTTLRPFRTKHKMVDDQLAASVEEVRKRRRAVRSVEGIWFFNSLPGQLTALTAQLIPQLAKLLLFKKQLFARCNPFTLRHDLVVSNSRPERHSHTILQFCSCCFVSEHVNRAPSSDRFCAGR